jgi:hypothetical protein
LGVLLLRNIDVTTFNHWLLGFAATILRSMLLNAGEKADRASDTVMALMSMP